MITTIIPIPAGSADSAIKIPPKDILMSLLLTDLQIPAKEAAIRMCLFPLDWAQDMVGSITLLRTLAWDGVTHIQIGDGIMVGVFPIPAGAITMVGVTPIMDGIIHGIAHAVIVTDTMTGIMADILIIIPIPIMVPEHPLTGLMEEEVQ